jgi:hypothetical protein
MCYDTSCRRYQGILDMAESLSPNKIVGGIKRAIVKQGRENEFESLSKES